MATKKPGEGTGRSNKIRFVLVEADISDGNLSELTQAISSALKPTTTVPRISRPATPSLPSTPERVIDMPDGVEEEVSTEQVAVDGNGDAPSEKRMKKFKPPNYLPNLLAGEKGKAFKAFADEKAPENKNRKFLVATYWLKERGDSPTANADKVYTCFKTAGWSTGFNDWNQPFHNLVHSEHLRKVGTGEFAINPLGEGAVMNETE
jgi:hypothetical protein